MPSSPAIDHFNPFTRQVAGIKQPTRFTFPYYYSPHPLCEIAMRELQSKLLDAGIDEQSNGQMYGVLLVTDNKGQLGYLSAHAGELNLNQACVSSIKVNFVPSAFDKNNFIVASRAIQLSLTEVMEKLARTNAKILESDTANKLQSTREQFELKIAQFQDAMKLSKQRRKQLRKEAETKFNEEQLAQYVAELGNESSREKRELKALKLEAQHACHALEQTLSGEENTLAELIHSKEHLEQKLEDTRLKHFHFLNSSKQTRSLFDLLNGQAALQASGECCSPKLLNFAFNHDLKPLALTEFWWGKAPAAEIRQHKNLYPVCQSKCFEILEHMLQEIELEDNPLIVNPAIGKDFKIVYQDDVIVVVNKPAEFLSVPGKFIEDSVYSRIKAQFPDATGPLIVHRLDMSTSGLLVLALTPETNKHVQQQFINRTVEKRYTALLDGVVEQDEGLIQLPLRGDTNDRPRQLVCFEDGRHAETTWAVINRNEGKTLVHLYPKTGRTHQLRVHCAHPQGLGIPITGDDLYGFKRDRLHLHAGYLKFSHPVTGEALEFEVDAEF
ncbi:RluA family pseudouridine synthase [Vibrio profundi]|uniref:RluA family pseudouridine synthase n=1 Tax=Vibrio TaxID=662 RepID=UPI00142EA24F